MKKQKLIGSCGISCGLCPRFQSKAKSHCLGCGPDGHCSYCSIFRCSSMKRGFETCAECVDFPCDKYTEWFDADSFVTHAKCRPNIQKIKELGLSEFLKEQSQRQELLEKMLEKYNPGKCVSLYCLASSLLSIDGLKKAIAEVELTQTQKAEAFKHLVQKVADEEQVALNLRK